MTQIRRDSLATHLLTSFETEIVVDLGCCSYTRGNGVEDSIAQLIRRFKPAVLFGFDPHPGLEEAVGNVYGTTVITSRRAAWIRDGDLGLSLNGNCTHLDSDGTYQTQTFDLASWLRSLPEAKAVLKMDVEGAEYVLLPYLIEKGLMERFSLLLVEWHSGRYANGYAGDREAILDTIECPVEEWQ